MPTYRVDLNIEMEREDPNDCRKLVRQICRHGDINDYEIEDIVGLSGDAPTDEDLREQEAAFDPDVDDREP